MGWVVIINLWLVALFLVGTSPPVSKFIADVARRRREHKAKVRQ